MKVTVGMNRKPDEARAFLGLPPRRIALRWLRLDLSREPHAVISGIGSPSGFRVYDDLDD